MVLAIHNSGVAEVRSVETPTAVVVDGVAYPRLSAESLAWLTGPATDTTEEDLDAGTVGTDADEFPAGVHLGGNELQTFVVSREILDRLDRLAAGRGVEVSDLATEALAAYLDGSAEQSAPATETVKKLPGWTGWDNPTRAAKNRKRQRERKQERHSEIFGAQDNGVAADAS